MVYQPLNLGEVLSPKGNYDTYTKFFKPIGIKNLFDGAMYPIDMDTTKSRFFVISSYTYINPHMQIHYLKKINQVLIKKGIKSGGNKNRLASVYLPMPGAFLMQRS